MTRHADSAYRPLYNAALSADPGDDMYGNLLPLHLRYLAANGRMSGSTGGISADGIRFFPQWIGVPDDAGGFLYSPSGSPEGYDMYGMQCRGPVALGGGWWMCGMRD
ncbi:hypothetical protein GOARA_021_00790 [Gordonia araii NBRC 100433]|uniref:Uncharacterized protein n=1 Tax=Gordonia araii NBRC 100433 TaxID=1073574 RepID=G7GZ17_9ACTN|nr:hypothetical protein [Gordonia araii]NNG97050.1 hypothetical protein [Gordonia araii NBRC 100433]GAB08842.1 hypothetical protein GOARA_021_00790 [Gordonia araii NBRC 100433]